LLLAAKKKKSRNQPTTSSGGFGGASMEPCPCGSSDTYSSCCGKLHKDVNAYKSATAEQVVRARYAAYAKKQVSS
jgi:SEC-C motif-containing protein